MHPISRLTSEHPILFGVCHALEVYAHGVAHGLCPRGDELGQFVHFFRGFVGGLRAAEEELVLEAMVSRGFDPRSGPVGSLLADNERTHQLLDRLGFLACNVHVWTEAQRKTLANTACDFARLLRTHLRNEEGVLFPLARLRLLEHVWTELSVALAQVQERHGGQLGRAQLEELGRELIRHYGARFGGDASIATA